MLKVEDSLTTLHGPLPTSYACTFIFSDGHSRKGLLSCSIDLSKWQEDPCIKEAIRIVFDNNYAKKAICVIAGNGEIISFEVTRDQPDT